MSAELPEPDDAAELEALRRRSWQQMARYLPVLAIGAVVWWLACHWIQRHSDLGDGAARTLPLIAVACLSFAIVKLTGFGQHRSPPLSPRLQALVQARRQRRLARARRIRIFGLIVMLLSNLLLALTGGDWGRAGIWNTILIIVCLSGLEDMLSPPNAARTAHGLSEQRDAVWLGFVILFALVGCVAVADAYRPGTSGRFLPVVLLIGALVPQIRLMLGSEPQPKLLEP